MQATEASADNEKDIDKILKEFWERTLQEIQASQPSTKYSLPLARIKKIMRFDEDVNMVSQEVLRMFDKCCVFFIQELTLRAWQSTLDSDRKTIKRVDIAHAIASTEDYDFLIDVVPREEWQYRPVCRICTSLTAQSKNKPTENHVASNAQLQQLLLGRAATPQLVAQYQTSLLQSQLQMQHQLQFAVPPLQMQDHMHLPQQPLMQIPPDQLQMQLALEQYRLHQMQFQPALLPPNPNIPNPNIPHVPQHETQ